MRECNKGSSDGHHCNATITGTIDFEQWVQPGVRRQQSSDHRAKQHGDSILVDIQYQQRIELGQGECLYSWQLIQL
jgi:hypothetical protein